MSISKAVIISAFILTMILSPVFVFSQGKDKYGLQDTVERTRLSDIAVSNSTPELLIADVVRIVLGFVGTIFFLLMLYGGIMWMTAMGSNEKVEKAKQILEMAVVGLVIVVASYAISIFIFSRFTTAPLETPQMPTSSP